MARVIDEGRHRGAIAVADASNYDTIVRFATATDQLELVVAAREMTESEVLVDEPTYRLTRWTNANGTVLEFLEDDAGHCFPGAAYLPFGCTADDPVHYGEAALEFYLAHPKDG